MKISKTRKLEDSGQIHIRGQGWGEMAKGTLLGSE